jgi:hypothetical protein
VYKKVLINLLNAIRIIDKKNSEVKMMRGRKLSFKELPESVRYALSLVIFAWFFFLISTSAYTGQISILHITMGMLICFAAFSLKNWARILTIIYDIFMIVMIGAELYFLVQSDIFTSLMLFIIKAGSILFFTVSTIFFLLPGTKDFYKQLQ